jgi:hypothetical protein
MIEWLKNESIIINLISDALICDRALDEAALWLAEKLNHEIKDSC